MFRSLSKFLGRIYHKEDGITGLETAIILIAFVTVAAVLAYTVLSAGIFSSERGKETVYSGLNSAQSTMVVKGAVMATTINDTDDAYVTFTLALAVSGASVDLSKLVYNYWDSEGNLVNGIAGVTFADLTNGGAATVLSGATQVLVTVLLQGQTGFTTALSGYDSFTLEIVPPTGATLNITRALPGDIGTVFGDICPLN